MGGIGSGRHAGGGLAQTTGGKGGSDTKLDVKAMKAQAARAAKGKAILRASNPKAAAFISKHQNARFNSFGKRK